MFLVFIAKQLFQQIRSTTYLQVTSLFALVASIPAATELNVYKWTLNINRTDIFHWFNSFYTVPSSTATITPPVWLDVYQSGQ
ncbi:unnamed protein product [Didymodactylos carnosus]|uniref:Uncharacterized protein n=1 Tax=Didymodactylos carnosus TaxID=1234261 RepID=A0A814U6X8_9BILA|nr:unnamed protein product [Didymodactylos carnosus]CAF3933626.1 unnamed protein product [Didymodactylos carnosus]